MSTKRSYLHRGSKRTYLSILLIVLIVAVFIILQQFDLVDINRIKNYIDGLGPLGVIAYCIIYIAMSLLGFSTILMTILAGTLFGLGVGMAIVVFSATLAAMIAFYISRYIKKSTVTKRPINATNRTDQIQKVMNSIEDNAEKRGFIAILILRLSFVPYIAISFAAGLVSKLKVRDFLLATLLVNIFSSFVFIYLGDEFIKNVPLLFFVAAIVPLLILMPRMIRKFKHGK